MNTKIIYSLGVVLTLALILSTPVSAGWWSTMFKVSSEEKQVIKAEIQTEVKQTNYAKGMAWEATTEKDICAAVGGCLKSATSAKNMLRYSKGIEETFVIYGGKETKKFINEQGLYHPWSFKSFTKEPDFLKITQVNGKITKMVVIDAKTSQAAARAEQEAAFNDLCRYSYVKCDVEYVIPKNTLSKSDANFLCLGTIPLALTGPVGVGIDALCFLATS